MAFQIAPPAQKDADCLLNGGWRDLFRAAEEACHEVGASTLFSKITPL
jgi:hypothetical protein